jgi:hypothetical protein
VRAMGYHTRGGLLYPGLHGIAATGGLSLALPGPTTYCTALHLALTGRLIRSSNHCHARQIGDSIHPSTACTRAPSTPVLGICCVYPSCGRGARQRVRL